MKVCPVRKGFSQVRVVLAVALFGSAICAAIFALRPELNPLSSVAPARDMPTLGSDVANEAKDLDRLEQYWNDRLTYPTGVFNPAWVRAAVIQHQLIPTALPAGSFTHLTDPKRLAGLKNLSGAVVPLSLSTTGFTALGPSPERMTGCSGCYDYTKTQSTVNSIAIDPTTTTNGSITAYLGSVGGGVWKTTHCWSTATTWFRITDDPLIATTQIDTVTIAPSNHNPIYDQQS